MQLQQDKIIFGLLSAIHSLFFDFFNIVFDFCWICDQYKLALSLVDGSQRSYKPDLILFDVFEIFLHLYK